MCGIFSVIAITYRYGSAVSLDNTYIHLHAISRLVGTNCTRKWRFDLNEGIAKFDKCTLHRNTPYPSVTDTVDIKLTSVLPPLFACPFSGSLTVVQRCLNNNILYVRYVLLVITAYLKVCNVLKLCLFCSCTSVWLYSRTGIYIYMQ